MLVTTKRRAAESAIWSALVDVLEAGQLYQQVSAAPAHDALQRQLLSDALATLASWLYEQSIRLAGEHVVAAKHQQCVTAWPLTRREREVAVHIAEGLSNRAIAENLVIALSTTERHVANILNKLGMRSRAQVAVWAIERGLRKAQPSNRRIAGASLASK